MTVSIHAISLFGGEDVVGAVLCDAVTGETILRRFAQHGPRLGVVLFFMLSGAALTVIDALQSQGRKYITVSDSPPVIF